MEIQIKDRFGNPVVPREWFLVPLFAIDEAVEKIKEGTLSSYAYDRRRRDFGVLIEAEQCLADTTVPTAHQLLTRTERSRNRLFRLLYGFCFVLALAAWIFVDTENGLSAIVSWFLPRGQTCDQF